MNETTVTTTQSSDKKPLIAVVGATSVGKTGVAIRLARDVDGEVVSADSRYLYRGMDVGTATPTEAEMEGVPHHLISFLNPSDDYSLTLFQRDAMCAIADIHARGRIPIVAGGTPLYVNALLEGWHIPEVPPDAEFRATMEDEARVEGADTLHRRLQAIDPVAAARIPAANVRRVIRALEIHRHTGKRMSEIEGKSPPPFRTLIVGLSLPREELYRRIDARVDDQIAHGWVDEVKELLSQGVSPGSPAMSAIGYQELIDVLEDQLSLESAVERIKFHTHRYARHQLTWLRRMQGVHWFDSRDATIFEQIVAFAHQFVAK
jgi:tRNA dimethylallyltransferase